MDALATTHDASVQMIDTSIVRVHQHAACIALNKSQSMGRSRANPRPSGALTLEPRLSRTRLCFPGIGNFAAETQALKMHL
jgi:hypothetical protein